MKIVVLDGYTLNPGDLSWKGIEALGELTVYEHTPKELIYERAKGAEIIFTNKTPLCEDIINKLPDLKYIGVLATGYNVVDVKAAADRNITVTNIPTYGTRSVAQMTFALILELCHHVAAHSDAVKSGEWSKCRDFCFWNYPLVELEGKTLGVIGFGRIGRSVADIALAFGMKVLGYTPIKEAEYCHENFSWSDLEEILKESDIITLHCPLFPETKGMINAQAIKKMKNTAFIINTSRGPLIDDQALADALNNKEIAGAALDVLSVEPPDINNPLLKADNCIITPHIAWATKEARERLMDIAVDNLNAFLSGTPCNTVN